MTIERDDVQAFLERYAKALVDGDVSAVADCYGLPGLVVSDDTVLAFSTRGEVEAAFTGAAEQYHARGLATTEPAIESFEPLGDNVASVDVIWNTRGTDGQPGPHEVFRYLLRDQGGLVIHVVVPRGGSD